MPLNEAKGFSRSMMTREQQEEQLAVIYGVKKGPSMSILDSLSPEERAQLIAEIKGEVNAQPAPPKEFDLNNPPKVEYRHQEFPRLVYHHGSRKHKAVHNDAQLQAAEEAGFVKEPFPSEVPEVELDEASAAEAAQVDAKLSRKKRMTVAE